MSFEYLLDTNVLSETAAAAAGAERASLRVLPTTTEATEWHAEERAHLTGEGRAPAFVDGRVL